jgi:DNA-binding SARP family transcriptional activator/Tfp pilus assembly protein PilF
VIELRTLGGCDLRESSTGRALGALLSQPRRLSLLIYLAAAEPRGSHQRDKLLGLFWRDYEQKRARAALRRALYFLKETLGEGVLVGRGKERVGLNPDRFWCDTWELRDALDEGRPTRALEIYVGELLPGFFVSDAWGFEEWLEVERAALRRTAQTAAVELADRDEAAGGTVAAAGWLRRSLEIVPDDEVTVRRLMTLLAEAGDRAGALRVFDTLERRLATEFDAEPSRPTRALADRLSRQDDAVLVSPLRVTQHATDPAAHELYVRGQETAERDREGNERAIERFREAIRLDPHFAEAHAALAVAYSHKVELFGASRNLSRIAIEAARRAIAIDPGLTTAHMALGQNLETLRRLADARRAYEQALEIDPAFAPAIWALAQLSTWAGDFEGGIVIAERALTIMPGDPRPFLALGFAYYCLDLEEQAEAWYERALTVWPEFTWALASLAYFRTVRGRADEARPLLDAILEGDPDSWVGMTCSGEHALLSGELERAREHLERAFSIDPGGRHTGSLRSVATYLARVLLAGGEPEWARQLLDQAEALNLRAISEGNEFGGVSVDVAAILALRGEPGKAHKWLIRASDRDGWRQYHFGACDPTLEGLRGEPWFDDWLRRMEEDVKGQRDRTLARRDWVSPP